MYLMFLKEFFRDLCNFFLQLYTVTFFSYLERLWSNQKPSLPTFAITVRLFSGSEITI